MTEQYLPKKINYESLDILSNGLPVIDNATAINLLAGLTVSVNPLNPSIADIAISAGASGLDYAPIVAIPALSPFPLQLNLIQLYDASGSPPLSLTLEMPSNPSNNDRLEIKEIGNSFVTVTLDGNGANVEGVFVASAPTVTVGLPRVNLQYQYDLTGNIWRIV